MAFGQCSANRQSRFANDPALGRFTQADTIVPQPGNPQALNRYAYGLNNPVKYNDPTGHSVPVDVGGYLPPKN